MKHIKEYLNEPYNPDWENVVEMATIGYPILNKKAHFIALHGTNAGDRERPHIHIYLNGDKRPFSKFNFEIALDELLCYNEINLIYMNDSSNNIKRTNRKNCSWNGYTKLKNDFEDWLYDRSELPGNFIDNLDAIIFFYNNESGGRRDKNPLLEYIKEHGMKISDRLHKYFTEQDKKQYRECFE